MHNAIKLFVGLGNPGEEYAATRHNAGAWFVQELARAYSVNLKLEKKFPGFYGSASLSFSQGEICLFIPNGYMNVSGGAVRAITSYYKIPLENVLIAHDELDFEPGVVRLKRGGGHGGHNGLRDIIQCLNSGDFYRLRIGIGHPGNKDLVSGYVLSRPSVSDKKVIMQSIENAVAIVPKLVQGDLEKAMCVLHCQ